MRARLTIDNVVFVADDWPKLDGRPAVFSCELRPEGTRPPGQTWWFSEGVWFWPENEEGKQKRRQFAQEEKDYLIEVSKVEREEQNEEQSTWIIERDEEGGTRRTGPLLAHPDGQKWPDKVMQETLSCQDLGDLAGKLDESQAKINGFGKQNFTVGDCVELCIPFFNENADYNKKFDFAALERKNPPGSAQRLNEDRETFLGLYFSPPDPPETAQPAFFWCLLPQWFRPQPMEKNEQMRAKAQTSLAADPSMSFVNLEDLCFNLKVEAKEKYESAQKKHKRRILLLELLMGILIAGAFVLWLLIRADGQRLSGVRKLMSEQRFIEARQAGTARFFFRDISGKWTHSFVKTRSAAEPMRRTSMTNMIAMSRFTNGSTRKKPGKS